MRINKSKRAGWQQAIDKDADQTMGVTEGCEGENSVKG